MSEIDIRIEEPRREISRDGLEGRLTLSAGGRERGLRQHLARARLETRDRHVKRPIPQVSPDLDICQVEILTLQLADVCNDGSIHRPHRVERYGDVRDQPAVVEFRLGNVFPLILEQRQDHELVGIDVDVQLGNRTGAVRDRTGDVALSNAEDHAVYGHLAVAADSVRVQRQRLFAEPAAVDGADVRKVRHGEPEREIGPRPGTFEREIASGLETCRPDDAVHRIEIPVTAAQPAFCFDGKRLFVGFQAFYVTQHGAHVLAPGSQVKVHPPARYR